MLPSVIDRRKRYFGRLVGAYNEILLSYSSEDYFKAISVESIFNSKIIKRIVAVFCNILFVICEIVGERSFITSGDPVMLIDMESGNAVPFKNGLSNPSTLVYFPISQNQFFTHPSRWWFVAMENKNRRVFILDGNRKIALRELIMESRWNFVMGMYMQKLTRSWSCCDS